MRVCNVRETKQQETIEIISGATNIDPINRNSFRNVSKIHDNLKSTCFSQLSG